MGKDEQIKIDILTTISLVWISETKMILTTSLIQNLKNQESRIMELKIEEIRRKCLMLLKLRFIVDKVQS